MATNTRSLPSTTTKTPSGVKKGTQTKTKDRDSKKDRDSFFVSEKVLQNYNVAMSASLRILEENGLALEKITEEVSDRTKKSFENIAKQEKELEENRKKNSDEYSKIKKREIKINEKLATNVKSKQEAKALRDELMVLNKKVEFIKTQNELLDVEEEKLNKQKDSVDDELRDKLAKDIEKYKEDKVKEQFEGHKELGLSDKYLNNVAMRDSRNNFLDKEAQFLIDSNKARQNGASEKDIKKAWVDMQMKHDEEMKKAFVKDFRANHETLAGIYDKTAKLMDKQGDNFKALLGPLNIITAPLEEFFGGSIFGALKGVIGGLGKKVEKFALKVRKVPKASDLVKLGADGMGALYIANKIEETMGGKKKKDNNSFGSIADLFGGSDIVTKAKSLLGGKISGASLVAGLAWTAVDAFHGWENHEDWGVSKVEGAIGGALAGNGEGFGNMAKNGIKWALTLGGVGGLVGGPVGMLIGALGGLAIGSILGYFGGETVAKEIKSIVDAFDIHSLSEGIKKVWDDSEKSFFGKCGLSFVEMFKWFKDGSSNKIVNDIKNGKKGKQWNDKQRSFQLQLAETVGSENYEDFFTRNIWTETLLNADKGENRTELNMVKYFAENKSNFNKEDADAWFGRDSDYLASAYIVLSKIWGSKILKDYFTFSDPSLIIGLAKGTYNTVKKVGGKSPKDLYGNDWENLKKYSDSLSMDFKEKRLDMKSLKERRNKEDGSIKVEDAIITNNGQVIKTSPKDTLVALKNIPYSMEQARMDTKKSVDSSVSFIGNRSLEQKLDNVITLLSNILNKEVVTVEMPKTTRSDLDMIIRGEIL